jgi:hypothetical protein
MSKLTVEELTEQVTKFASKPTNQNKNGTVNWDLVDSDMCVNFGYENSLKEIRVVVEEFVKKLKEA